MRLLGHSLSWLHADVYGNFDAMPPLAAEDACMFGAQGIEEAVSFKRRWLTEAINYKIDAIHEIDLAHRVVVVGFDCLCPGKEGRGVDVIQFREDGRVAGVAAVRHTDVGKA
jgi:hypothetical protein